MHSMGPTAINMPQNLVDLEWRHQMRPRLENLDDTCSDLALKMSLLLVMLFVEILFPLFQHQAISKY